MHIENTNLAGLKIISPAVFKDNRGYFFESYNKKKWTEIADKEFVQDNESMSNKGILRGLHFQKPPYAQAKLVRVIRGSVLDVVVDLRRNSPTYGQHSKIILSEENKKQMYVPEGFAHGFLVLENYTIFSYKCTAFYHKPAEDAILWNDPTLAIEWGIANPILSEKDQIAKKFDNFVSPF
ncbi:MAG: dTDP-4-dehydrorhamnose 3,5-epimerase [Flavobacteriales bacterium]|nr:MAG: dTDP-4-dehydrorhamnose 3,5-epimerase [Flavobacteriales bacterium]PIE48835.1 MAG: dTDP-4-dehydrorhamnose 3,5-epimerase [Flavobacteriales bacterium]